MGAYLLLWIKIAAKHNREFHFWRRFYCTLLTSPASCSKNTGSGFRTLRFWRNLFLCVRLLLCFFFFFFLKKKTPISHPCSPQIVNMAWSFQRMGLLTPTAGRSKKMLQLTGQGGGACWCHRCSVGTVISLAPASWWKEWPAASFRSEVEDVTGSLPWGNSHVKALLSERGLGCFAAKIDELLRTHIL